MRTKTFKPKLTEEQTKLLHSVAHSIWNYIGYDVFQAIADNDGEDINDVTIPRAHVLELVCDAGRLEDDLERKDAVLADLVSKMDYQYLLKILKPAFAFNRYGM